MASTHPSGVIKTTHIRHICDWCPMQLKYHNIHESRSYVTTILGDAIRFGRSPQADVVLNSPFISDFAAVLKKEDERWLLEVQNGNGCGLDGIELSAGKTAAVAPNGQFEIFPFEFQLDPDDKSELTDDDIWNSLEDRSLQLVKSIHIILLDQMNVAAVPAEEINPEYLLRIERNLEVIARDQGILQAANADLLRHLAGHCVRSELIDDTLKFVSSPDASPLQQQGNWSTMQSTNASRERDLQSVKRQVAQRLNLVELGEDCQLTERMRQIDSRFRAGWKDVATGVLEESLSYLCLRQLKKQIKDIVFGYGPLEDLLRLPTVSEVMVVGSNRIFVERGGVLENSGRRFVSDDVTTSIIERIVSRVGRRIDKSQPVADARLSDGSRVNAVISPIALDGPLLTVRKFPDKRITVRELVEDHGSLTPPAAAFLEASVVGRKNILISGGTGTGKTTLLNCLADFIPDRERIVTIEDTAELRINKRHVARMETKAANIEGNGAFEIADLVRNALRMRPDRVVVGECRGKEALWMLQAMNTGHDGSLTTIHANSARDVVLRLEVMVQSAADLPVDSIHRQVASAVDLIVQLGRLRGGRRVVSEIAEVLPSREKDATVRIRRIFALDETQSLLPTGQLPSFMPQLLHGELLDLDAFYL